MYAITFVVRYNANRMMKCSSGTDQCPDCDDVELLIIYKQEAKLSLG